MQASKLVVIGATSAIAKEVGRIYAGKAWAIDLVARSQEKMQILEEDFKARGAVATRSLVFDFAVKNSYQELVDWAGKDSQVDVLLIAHGILGDQQASEASNEEALSVFRLNFLSHMSLLNLFAKQMEARAKGTMAIISSVAGDRGRQSNYFYGTAKGALSIYCQGLRNRLFKKNVHVITIKPGFVKTPMTAHLKQGPLFAEPEQVASDIVKAIEKKRDVLYTPWFWWGIMTIIKLIPEFIFKRLKL
ncbi:MAG: SDR family oxidoreductase [Oligoflexales bacterium]